MIRSFSRCLLGLAIACLGASPALAEDWKYDFALYGVGASLDGRVGAGPVVADVDVGFDDLLDNLEIGGLAFFRARTDRFAVMVDAIYLGLGAANAAVDVDVDQLILEVDVAWRFSEVFELLFGARYVDLDTRIAFSGPLGLVLEPGGDWVDPVVGLRIDAPLSERWQLIARADVGGFGIGSDSSTQASFNLGYRPSDGTSIVFGYRVLDFDYDDGEGLERLVYDATISGPQIGLVFHF